MGQAQEVDIILWSSKNHEFLPNGAFPYKITVTITNYYKKRSKHQICFIDSNKDILFN